MQIDLTQIILGIITLISAVLTSVVVPWMRTKIQINNDKLSENQQMLLNMAINTAVKAAEQLYKSDEGQQKKAYVLSVLESQGYTVDSVALNAAIESAVKSLKLEMSHQ